MLNRNRNKKVKKDPKQEPNNKQTQNSNNILSKIGSTIINKIPNLKVPNLDINIKDYFQSSSFINENSVSKGYRSFLDGFNRNIIGTDNYSGYNTEFIEPYFPQDIIDSLTAKEGKYDIIGIFNGECLVYNKDDKKVESHNCELTKKKMEELEAAAKIQNLYRRRIIANNQMQQPMIEAHPHANDGNNPLLLENGSEVGDVPELPMIEAGPQERLMIENIQKPNVNSPIPMLSPPPQELSQFKGFLPQIKFPTTFSLPKIVEEPPLRIENSPQASQHQQNMNTGSEESKQQQTNTNTGSQESQQQNFIQQEDTGSEKLDMKIYTKDNIKKNIHNDILNLGKNPIDKKNCEANQFITSDMCKKDNSGNYLKEVNKKFRSDYSENKNRKCKAYANDRFSQQTEFCEEKIIPDEYKDPPKDQKSVYKEKYDNAKKGIEAASTPSAKAANSSNNSSNNSNSNNSNNSNNNSNSNNSNNSNSNSNNNSNSSKKASTETKTLLITNGPPQAAEASKTTKQQQQQPEQQQQQQQQKNNDKGIQFIENDDDNSITVKKNGIQIIKKLSIGDIMSYISSDGTETKRYIYIKILSGRSIGYDKYYYSNTKQKWDWGSNRSMFILSDHSDNFKTKGAGWDSFKGLIKEGITVVDAEARAKEAAKQKEIKQANAIKNKINVTKPNKINFRTIKGYFSAIKNNIDEFKQLKNDESKKIITDHIKGLITNIKDDFDTLNNKDIENDADKGIRKETRTNLESLETKLLAKMNIYDADIVKFINNINEKILAYDKKKAAAEEKAKAETTPQPASQSILENEGRKVQSIDDVAENANLYSFFNPGDNNNSTQGGKKVNKTKKSKKSKKNHQKKQGRKTRKNRS